MKIQEEEFLNYLLTNDGKELRTSFQRTEQSEFVKRKLLEYKNKKRKKEGISMDLEIKDKVIIITGGGSGIGKATALIFADEGCDIAIVDFNIEKAQETAEEIRSKGRV